MRLPLCLHECGSNEKSGNQKATSECGATFKQKSPTNILPTMILNVKINVNEALDLI